MHKNALTNKSMFGTGTSTTNMSIDKYIIDKYISPLLDGDIYKFNTNISNTIKLNNTKTIELFLNSMKIVSEYVKTIDDLKSIIRRYKNMYGNDINVEQIVPTEISLAHLLYINNYGFPDDGIFDNELMTQIYGTIKEMV